MSRRRLPVLIRGLHEVLKKATQKGYKDSPGPKGQTCESCEFGELFDDDKGAAGWCRVWDREVGRSAWCESWTRSARLDTPAIEPNDSPEQAKDTQDAPAKGGAKAKGKKGSGKFSFKKRPASLQKKRPPLPPLPIKKPKAEPEPEAEPEEENP